VKILIVGLWNWSQYEAGFARGLELNGCHVDRVILSSPKSFHEKLFQLVFHRYGLDKNHTKVIEKVKMFIPNVVLFWRPTIVSPKTIEYVNGLGIKTVSYNNDDPFNYQMLNRNSFFKVDEWIWYYKCLPYFKYNFFYRTINCIEAAQYNVQHADVLLPYYLPWSDKNIMLSESEIEMYKTQVVFVGHYESDQRVECINLLVYEGIQVKIWSGENWKKENLRDTYDYFYPIVPALGESYAKALCGADICLVFLSKVNRDTYTRRCFEIPACEKLMLAERTEDLLNFFEEDKEVCFFSNKEELLSKVKWLLANPDIRQRIARAGYVKVSTAGHSVQDRAKYFLNSILD
jgi:spore maturation protein CgeB